MSKIIVISNRLSVSVTKTDEMVHYEESIGGLATGLNSYLNHTGNMESIWVGWPGIASDELSLSEQKGIEQTLRSEYNSIPVFLSKKDVDLYYYGFCNNTIWPLFHYFTNKTKYETDSWEGYQKVNHEFMRAVEPIIEENDTVWIHDYQLMLLPRLVKEHFPNAKVGFFLHIPFPSFEIFRLLIWREEILRGLLGADLIGFHTYDYVRHFLSTTRRLLGLENNLNVISYEDRYVLADAFPMGIDYERFASPDINMPILSEIEEMMRGKKDMKLILSIDRLDYTKGIPQRIRAFDRFLAQNPHYHKKVRLNLIVAPSRVEVESYEELRREITELVSEINGKYGTVNWMPIWFFYQSFEQNDLIAFYNHSDVLLVTPLRDGMNLVVKEYIAARTDYEGMVVISETAGAASELSEAVIVNPNDIDAIAKGIQKALDMPRDEKIAINKVLHERIKRYNVSFWASEFLTTLDRISKEHASVAAFGLDKQNTRLKEQYAKAKKRLLLLDYDGTLVDFTALPEQAKPDEEIRNLLAKLVADPKNTVAIISGRDHQTLDRWLGDIRLHLIAAHGLWVKHPEEPWVMSMKLDNDWKEPIRHIMEVYMDRMPGALIEEKDYSLAFHFRQCEPDMAAMKLSELREALMGMTLSMSLGIQEGNKVLEVKDSRVDKGYAAAVFLKNRDYDFIMGVGDDYTDEDLFAALPNDAYSIKIGLGKTHAKFYLKSWRSMRKLLSQLSELSE
jgi:trehalose 6-phosphate synthase/phosphatase